MRTIVTPFVFDEESKADLDSGGGGFPFPDVSDREVADDWEEVETWMVDSSGFGRPDEPALTAGQFRSVLLEYLKENPDDGFALTGIGQFQVYVSAFRYTYPLSGRRKS